MTPSNLSAHPGITFLIPSLEAGGAERQLIGLAAALHASGWRVLVLTFHDGGSFASDLTERGVAVESLAKRGRWDLIGFAYRLIRAVRRERPAILHAYLLTPNILSIAMKPFMPPLRVVWGVRASNMDFSRYGRISSLAFTVSCRLARFADLIICNSSSGRAFHAARGYPPARMVVIPNGIDTTRFSPRPAARTAVRAEWRATDTEILVGLIGRLDPMKDHPTFLHALRRVANDWPNVRFICVGSGSTVYRRELEQLASDLGINDRVVWTGARSDLPAVYNALDLVVSSSQWGEGFPNVIAEAMATGVPCVVTDVGDSRLVVGESGWVCRPGDPDELARGIEEALTAGAGRARRGREARARIISQFSLARLERATTEELSRLISRI